MRIFHYPGSLDFAMHMRIRVDHFYSLPLDGSLCCPEINSREPVNLRQLALFA